MLSIKRKTLIFSTLVFIVLGALVACSNNKQGNENIEITKDYVSEHAKEGLSGEEVKKIFGEPQLSGVIDNTETWLYYAPTDPANYEPSLEAVNHQAILDETVDYEFYINFVEEKAYIYSYFYKSGEEVQEHQVLPEHDRVIE